MYLTAIATTLRRVHVELDLEFKIGQPIRQGDVFGFWDWRARPSLAKFGVIVTADCDIENGRSDQDLVYLRIISQADYIEVFWSRAKLEIARKKSVDDLVGQVNKLRRSLNSEASDLTVAEMEQWIASEASANIVAALDVTDAREIEKLTRNLDRTRNTAQLSNVPLGTSCLDHLLQVRGQDRAIVLKQASNDLRSERDEVFFLTSLTERDDTTGYYVLLDHIGAIRKDQLSDSLDAVKSGLQAAYKFGALAKTYKYAVAQRFAFLFQKIGLPNDHKHRHDAMLAVLDADGVRDNAPKRETYLTTRRSPRLMPLSTTTDREVMLDIYDRYRADLKKQGLISVDQLTSDYLGFLDSFRWDARRNRMGYDALFVDEFHLFSALERLTFRSLLRNAGPHPVILIALDPRQSPRAALLSVFGDDRPELALGVDRSAALTRGEAEKLRDFEFDRVFRYTPEIADLLTFVNLTFPETDLAEEWLPSVARSALPSGERPIAHEVENRVALYDYAVAKAQSSIKGFGRGKIAILTLSHSAFQEIKNAGRYANKLYVVDSRDSLNRLQYVGGRIVLSMPEYVAGVQFDHVLVADVNEMDDLGRHTAVTRDRFGSNLYLAISRARQAVTILGNRRAGGLATVIRAAAANNILAIE